MVRPTSLKTIVSRIFLNSQRPIYLLDAAGKIVFCNQALSDWTNLPHDQLQHATCVYGVSDQQDTWTRRLAVPPQVKDAGDCSTTVSCRLPDGSISVRRAHFFLLNDSAESTLVIVDDQEWNEPEPSPLDVARLHREVADMRRAWSSCYRLDSLVGTSAVMQQVRAQVQLAAESNCPIVVVGKEGVGRETIARTIHHERSRGQQMLVPLSCALLDVELLQTTIETLIKQMAELDNEDASVLLLLEIDKLSMDAQSALLGFWEISELGLEAMATSSTSLHKLVKHGTFRAELAYHLATLEISVPPLRERVEDIPLLVQWMLEQSSSKDRLSGFTEEALKLLLRYHWPREVNELRDVVETAAKAAKSAMIEASDLPNKIGFAVDAAALPEVEKEEIQLDQFLGDVEAELISRAIRAAKGNRAQAARALGISRGKLLRRIEQLGLEP